MQADLFSLVNAVGPEGEDDLADSFSSAMGGLAADNRDALLGLAMEHGPFRRLMSDVFSYQSPAEIASTVLEGAYGRNMLALSNALTSLPLERVSDEVRATIHQLLPGTGRTATETAFLDHMIAVRERVEPEPSLAAADHTYLAVAQASAIKTSDLDVAKRAIGAAGAALDAAGVRTMFSLLDQQIGTDQAQSSAAGLITMVPRLVVERQLPLAEYILNELNRRADSIGGTDALRATATPASMGALIDIVIEDDSRFDMAAMILKSGGEEAGSILVSEAITRKADGIALAERFLGKRAIDLLQTAVLEAQWFQLAPVVSRLTVEGGPRSIATIEALLRRPDAQSRKEIVQGLASAGGPVAERLLCEIVRDPNPEVAVAAARELAKAKMPGGSVAIAARLGELDIDNADFELARELISALARTPGEAADATLKKLGSRRAIIKRGHFNDIQTAVAAALQARTQGASR
jgi:hypothetical protein